jgi:purine-binding chemotaxis protein CheW
MRQDSQVLQLAVFKVGSHDCAIDIMDIKEIVNPIPITRVPRAPGFLEGVVELRGAIVPVVDLRRRFELPSREDTTSTKYIIVSMERRIIGLVVDSVEEVISVERSELRAAPPLLADETAQPFSGMCRHGDRLILILDIKVLLTHKERLKLSQLDAKDIS